MILRPTALERAFELARSGDCPDVIDIRKALKAEGLSDAQISGVTLTRQLRGLCAIARNTSLTLKVTSAAVAARGPENI